jgi:twinkle protein
MLTDKAIAWLEARGLDPEMASGLGWKSVNPGVGGEEIAIPYLVNGVVVNHKYRCLDRKSFRQDKGGQQVFYNYDCLIDETLLHMPLIITEGEMDALAVMQAGHPRVVSVPGGAPSDQVRDDSPSRKYGFLEAAKPLIAGIREIVLAVDGDNPGAALLRDLGIRLGKARCKWVRWPRGCKDANDALNTYGQRGVTESIARAAWVAVPGVYRFHELPPHEPCESYSCGFPPLDPHFRVRMGDLSVWTGIPGHGKTSLVNFLTFGLAREHAFRIAIASFEQNPQIDHVPALMELYLGFPARCSRTQRLMCSDTEHNSAHLFVEDHYVFLIPDEEELADLDWVLEVVATAVKRHECRIVVIDPWNEIDHSRPDGMSLTEYTGYAIKQFKRVAKALDCHIMLVAHPAKMDAGKVPSMYSISDSAHWANKPDAGISIYKPHIESDIAEIHILKSRYWGQIGKPGEIRVRYNTVGRTYTQIDWPKED